MGTLQPAASLSVQDTTGTQSLDRAMALLQLIAKHHEDGIHLQQLIELSGLNRTTAHRQLSALARAGLVSRQAPQQPVYRLGIQAMALGITSLKRAPLVELVRPVMQALARRSGEAVFLVVRSGDFSHCVHVQEGNEPNTSFVLNIGRTRLLGLGLPSFAMLARMPDDEFSAHYQRNRSQYQERGVTRRRLWRWIQQTRELGYAYINAQGLGSVAMHLPLGACADAAIGIVTPARMTRAASHAYHRLLDEAIRPLLPQLQAD